MFVPNIIDDSVDSAPNDLPNLRFQTITLIEVTNAIEFYIPMSDPMGTRIVSQVMKEYLEMLRPKPRRLDKSPQDA